MHTKLRKLLDALLVTHSPSGDEGEMDRLCLPLLEERCDEAWMDANGNLIGKIAGESAEGAVILTAHKDEIGTIVRKVDEDGKIWLDPLGGCVPWSYGEGPFDVLGEEVITGILCVGSTHSSHLSPLINDAKTKALTWEMCYIDCKLDRRELLAKGVGLGTRACVARARKTPLYIGDCVAGYALDDKASIAVLLRMADRIRQGRKKPKSDVYLGITGAEETGIMGGAYVCHSLPVETHIAVEIAPIAPEYDIRMTDHPVIFYKDAVFVLHKGMADELSKLADRCCGGHQPMLVRSFGSDATVSSKYGLVGRAGCIGFPTQNSHGYEIGHLGAMENCAKLLAEFVTG